MEDVAFAQNLWTNTMEKLPPTASREDRYNVFANALRNSGSYQWKGEQIDKVLMNLVLLMVLVQHLQFSLIMILNRKLIELIMLEPMLVCNLLILQKANSL